MRPSLQKLFLALVVTTVVGCECPNPNTNNDAGGGAGGDGGGSVGGGGGGGDTGGGGGGSVGGGGGATGGGGGGGGAQGGGAGGGEQDAGCGLVTCASSGAECGLIGDGCGGVVDCGQCAPPTTCGGGGVASKCGGTNGCVPRTCATIGADCGPQSDGCGHIISCGSCTLPDSCGGGGIPGRCGTTGSNVDGGVCIPRTCADANANCGVVGDGCGGLTASCGTCTGSDTCGGGGTPSRCGGGNICMPRTCAQANANCGQIGDGCGNLINCGSCSGSDSCGGGGLPNQCGQPPACVPKTCAQLGATCGVQGDGCGGATPNCGSCDGGTICGGGGTPSVCGSNVADAGTCTNLCLRQVTCDAGTTTVTGTVLAPTNPANGYGNPDPIYNALVYVPNDAVAGFDAGVTCDQCSATASGKPLVSTFSAVNGTFTLSNVPCGANIPLVIQLGRWRRQITIPSVACCGTTALTAAQTHLPRNKAEGDIPLIAVVTGNADPIECVLPKLGIDATEFTLPTGTGRVRFYRDNGANFSGGAPAATTLFNSLAELSKYDLIILDCVGSQVVKTAAQLANMRDYANSGGRIFMSHYGYVWPTDRLGTPGNYTTQASPFPNVATWAPQGNNPTPQTALPAKVDQTFPKGITFAQWLQNVGASATLGNINIDQTRFDFTAVIPPSQQWVFRTPTAGTNYPVEFSFNAPVGSPPAAQCGRVLFSDFHVNTGGTGGGTFPASCNAAAPLTPQEKVLEFLLFDLSSCITPDVPVPTCSGTTCATLGFNCGIQADGCGGTLNCGTCAAPQTCGGGGRPGVCGSSCTPVTCSQLGVNCGQQGDGCGGLIDCGTCTSPQTCGGGGVPGQCGNPTCTAQTCTQLGFNCGLQSNGCGGTQDCGMCPSPLVCGATAPGVCGSVACTPLTCAQQNLACGPAGDGCGNVIQCGSCTPPDTCGGGGTQGVCGHPPCTPRTCAQVGAECGAIADGCGSTIDCGTCTAPQTCGGGGTPNVCGGIG